MQTHFTFDELTPLEQCIANFMALQELQSGKKAKKNEAAARKNQ